MNEKATRDKKTIREQPDPYPDPRIPNYFKRLLDETHNPQVVHETQHAVFFNLNAGQRFTIYGFAKKSNYPEDISIERRIWKDRKAFCAMNFSVKEPDGELGFVPINTITPITQEEFEEAKAKGWRIGNEIL